MLNIRIISAILLFLFSISANADVVKGRVIDSQTKDPLEGASLKIVSHVGNAQMEMGTTTNSDGYFTFICEAMKTEMTISFIGYYEKTRRIVCTEGRDTLDIGDVELMPNEIMLQAVEVKAHAKRFTMRGDTIVFHPEAFKLEDGDRLESLIQKLPGVQTKDGELYWNGRPVKLRMNGNETLSSDLVGQLPAEAVKEIKGYEKQSEYSERSGNNDGEEEHVLDIVIKPGFLEKWYGQATASGYTSGNYEGMLRGNYLSDNNPLMTYIRVGDDNTYLTPAGFNGLSGTMGGASLYRQQIGALGYKHQWNPKFSGWTQPSYWWVKGYVNHDDDRYEESTKKVFMGEDGYSTYTDSEFNSYNHKFETPLDFQGYFNLTPTSQIFLPVSAGYSKGRITKDLEETNSAGYDAITPINRSHAKSAAYTEEKNFSIVPNYYKYFGKNMLYVGTRLEYKNGSKEYSKQADYDYLQTGQHMTDVLSYRNVYHNLNTTFGAYASYGFSDNANAALQYKFQYTDDYEKFDYQRNGGIDYNNSSEQTTRTFHNFFVLAGAFNVSKLTLKPSFTFDLQSEHTDYKRAALDTTCVRNNLLPKLTLDAIWKPNKLNNLKATLLYESKLPEVLSTMRYVDDTNPLYIEEGNPDLKRYANLGADVNYVLTLPKHEQMLSVTLKYFHLFDPIQSVLFYNTETGAYRCRQENTKGKDSFSAEVGYDRSLGKYWEWQNNMTFSTASAYGVLTIFDNNSSRTLARQTVNTFNYNPTFKFQRDDWKLTLKSNVQIKYNSYENDAANDFTLYYYGADANVQKTFWQKFTVYLNGGFMGRKGYHTERFNHDYLIMSAGAWYKFMKNKLTVRLDFDDIFNKQRYCVYNATETSTSRAESLYANHLSNYVKLTLTYDFDAKGGKKK